METGRRLTSGRRVAIYIVALPLGLIFLVGASMIATTFSPAYRATLLAAQRAKLANEFNQVQTAVLGYYTEYSEYPAAPDNATLIKMLTQNNPRGIAFLALKSSDQNANGELLDPWDTPLQLSVGADGHLLLRSAGPDKIFGTADDITNQ